jgi:Ca2+-binding EF-hand superfamily protein
MTSGGHRQKLEHIFKLYDINNDGFISVNEMADIIQVKWIQGASKVSLPFQPS